MKRPDSEVLESFQKLELLTMQEALNTPATNAGVKKVKLLKSSLKKIPTPAIYQSSRAKSPEAAKENHLPREVNDLDPALKASTSLNDHPNERTSTLFNHQFKLRILSFIPETSSSLHSVSLETWLYRPAFSSIHDFFPDSFTISSVEKTAEGFLFDSKTVHSLDVIQCKNAELKDFQIEFYLKTSQEAEELIADGVLHWEEIISNDSNRSIYTIPLYSQETLAGTLRLKFSQDRPLNAELDSRVPELLLISIDHIYRLEGTPNLYIQYKSPFDKQVMRSKVLWNYCGQQIDHELLLPSSQLVARLNQKCIIFEIWSKNQNQSKEDLIGLGKVALAGLSPVYPLNLYPTVIFDDYVAIVSPGKGCEAGYMKLCIAYGTSMQIHKFTLNRRALAESGSKTQDIRTVGTLQSLHTVYRRTLEPEMVEVTFVNPKLV